MAEQLSLYQGDPEYEAFVEKFKAKKTTDDCYTPPEVYDTIKKWVCMEYGVGESDIVRPFWPGEDYERYDYPEGCVVLDNPPFSILTEICGFYIDRGINFFLFAPSLTILSSRKNGKRMNHIVCDCDIVYENGAIVRTSFVTNLGMEKGIIAQTHPRLTQIVNDTVQKLKRAEKKELPKYEYPNHILTAAMMQKYSKYGIELSVTKDECIFIPAMDAQREVGKTIFGGGLLLPEKAAAEKAAAEKAAAEKAAAEKAAAERATAERAHKWELSNREMEIIKVMGRSWQQKEGCK